MEEKEISNAGSLPAFEADAVPGSVVGVVVAVVVGAVVGLVVGVVDGAAVAGSVVSSMVVAEKVSASDLLHAARRTPAAIAPVAASP